MVKSSPREPLHRQNVCLCGCLVAAVGRVQREWRGGVTVSQSPPFPRPPAWEMLLYSRVLPLPHPHGQISPAHLSQTAHRHMWASLCNPLLWRNRQQHVELLVVKCQSPLLGHSLLVPFYFSCLMMQSAELGPNFLSIR